MGPQNYADKQLFIGVGPSIVLAGGGGLGFSVEYVLCRGRGGGGWRQILKLMPSDSEVQAPMSIITLAVPSNLYHQYDHLWWKTRVKVISPHVCTGMSLCS